MLEIDNLHAFYGRISALKGVVLNIQLGQIFSVLGANGAGKTTLLRSILGLTRTTGTIQFQGRDIAAVPTPKRVRAGIALVPEGRRLFPEFTVEENLRIGAFGRTDDDEVDADIERMCTFFPILRQRYHQKSSTLSGGEGQMLAISRALLSRPKLLLLDEPSVGLMPTAVAKIFEIIAEVSRAEKLTVLLAEQNIKKALAISDRAAVLEQGKIMFEDAAAAVANDHRVKDAYLGG